MISSMNMPICPIVVSVDGHPLIERDETSHFVSGDFMRRAHRSLLLSLLSLSTAVAPETSVAQTTTSVASSYDVVLTQFEHQFVAAAQAMPSDQYDFSPSALPLPQAQFKGVRTFAEEVKHVAEMNYVIFSVMSGLKPDMQMEAVRRLKKKNEILSALEESFAYGHRALATLTTENENERPTDSHGMTRAGIAAYIIVHDADHYGQMSEYLRLNGIIPPQSR